jgi:hypothetical protein
VKIFSASDTYYLGISRYLSLTSKHLDLASVAFNLSSMIATIAIYGSSRKENLKGWQVIGIDLVDPNKE